MSKLSKLIKHPVKFFMDLPRPAYFYKDISLHKICDFVDVDSKKPVAVLIGFADWKHEYIHHFLPEYSVAYLKRRDYVAPVFEYLSENKDITPIIWGKEDAKHSKKFFDESHIKRMEDGFLRSYNIGANKTPPYSLILDDVGLYFDCNQPSNLENYLNKHQFTDDEIICSNAAMKAFIDSGVSKYNKFDDVDIDPYFDRSKKEQILHPLNPSRTDAPISNP